MLISGLAVFAQQLGLDQNAGWGRGRILTLTFGLLLAIASAVWRFQGTRVANLTERIKSLLGNHPVARWWGQSRIAGFLAASKLRRVYVLAALAALFVITVYVWFISVGLWTIWPKSTFTYDLLASAFLRGHVALDYKPNPALLALQNPYDPEARGDIPVLWDASLYNGKYYLYFGPVPGLILAAAKVIFPRQIADQYLVFTFLCGLFVFNILLVISWWSRFFQELPVWTVPLSILFVGLVCPIPWLLNRPAAYEAAIASSQLFFIGGLYFAYSALGNEAAFNWKLLLASTFWICAIGSRTIVVIPIAFMIFMLLWWMYKSHFNARSIHEVVQNLASLALPLGLGALILGWYNWMRFGSPLEFGFRYQLTWMDLNELYNQTFSPAYLLPNLYNYLANPFEIFRVFPFLKPSLGQAVSALRLNVPIIYRSEQVTGLLFGAPFVLLAAIPPLSMLSRFTRRLLHQDIAEPNKEHWLLLWITLSLAGSVILAFAFLLLFFYATMRYLADIIPSLALLASIGFWQGDQFLRRKPLVGALYSVACVGLALISILVSMLLAVTSYDERFRHLNRPLLEQLIRLLGR
jgi:hypothetical protein